MAARAVVVVFKVVPVGEVGADEAEVGVLVEGVADVAVEEGVAALGEAVEAACFALRRDARAEGEFGAGDAVACAGAEHVRGGEVAEIVGVCAAVFFAGVRRLLRRRFCICFC